MFLGTGKDMRLLFRSILSIIETIDRLYQRKEVKMFHILIEIITETATDTLKLVPFLFLTYVLMEWLEHRTGSRTQAAIRRAGKAGPLFGGMLGVFPQCGFSAAASNLYAGGLITAGTLVAVFLSTSDEMLPIFLSEAVPVMSIVKILAAKIMIGVICGFALDFLYHGILRREIRYKNIHTLCESEHCKCEEGIFPSALRHTVQITAFIFLVTLALEAAIEGMGEDALSHLILDRPVAGECIAGLIGLIPNCASSVVITQLYLEQVIGAGPMMAGLLTNAGVGVLVLCRMNRRRIKQNMGIIAYVYLAGVAWGILIDLCHITF